MDDVYFCHYITASASGLILSGWSTGPSPDRTADDAICINDRGGYQFRLFPGGEENPSLYTEDGIPLYRWDGAQVVRRSEEEVQADRAAIPPPPPSEQERLRADVDFLAAMQGVAL